MTHPRHIAIVGAGPIGVEAAVRAIDDGFSVTVYDAGDVGSHVRQWRHVQLFSPWKLNRSSRGSARLQNAGVPLADGEATPTGGEYLRQYLLPLAESLGDDVQWCLNTSVRGISRRQRLKSEMIGDDRRAASPFVLDVDGPEGCRFDNADVVIDASGVLSNPNGLGPGGLDAAGEHRFGDRISRVIPDVSHNADAFAGRHILVVGHGHSALTSLRALHELREQAPKTRVHWSFRAEPEPRDEIEDDRLQLRATLDRFGNAASRGDIEGIAPLPRTAIRRLEADGDGDGLRVVFERNGEEHDIGVDHIVANVGYRPDTSLFRELQVHLCYATEGPMNLAATLIGGDSGDCLDQSSGGIDTLSNPEPDFFVLGAKSYGRNSNFLLSIGFDQIDTVFDDGLS